MIKTLLSYPATLLDKLIKTKFVEIISSNPILATLTLVSLVVFWSFPSYDVAYVTHEMDSNWAGIFLQVKEPFRDHSYLYSMYAHSGKLAFRFVPALFLNILHIDTITGAFVFQFFTLVMFYYLLMILFNQLFIDPKKSFVYALAFCFVTSGHVYVTDYRGIFDTLALDFLLLSFIFRSRVYVVFPLLLAYFCDERALVAASGFFLINIFGEDKYQDIRAVFNGIKLSSNVYLLLSFLLYFTIRFYLGAVFGLKSTKGGIDLFFSQINYTFYTICIGLEGFILVFILILRLLCKRKFYFFGLLLIVNFLVIFYIAQSVFDISRSMSYVLLILILITLIMDRLYPKEVALRIIALVIVINILYVDSYPLFLQLFRMKFITHSI